MPDYIPQSNGDLRTWADNFKTKIAIHGPLVGLTAPQVTTLQARCDNIDARIVTTEQAKADYAEAVEAMKTAKTTEIGALRLEANRIKTNGNYTNAIGDDLQIVGSPEADIDFSTFQPEATAKAFPGYIEIKFKKPGRIDGVNIYRRAVGTTDWGNKIAYDTNSPYQDASATAGTAYDYRLIAVVDDIQEGNELVIGNVRAV